jgi:hypothetical protein
MFAVLRLESRGVPFLHCLQPIDASKQAKPGSLAEFLQDSFGAIAMALQQ